MGEAALKPATLPDIPDRPILPEHQVEVWNRLCQRMSDCRSRAGVYLLLCGWSYRESAKAVGLAYRTLSDAVVTYGLRPAVNGTDRVILNHRQIEVMTTEAIIDKGLEDKLKDESARDLAVIAGISRDKIRDHEKQAEQSPEAMTILERIGQSLTQQGLRLDISLAPIGDGTVHAPHAIPETRTPDPAPIALEPEPQGSESGQ